MLTIFKEIFTWWNHQTLGTRINTILFGKLIGEKLKQQKYLMNGILGYITLIIKLKICMN